MILGKVMMAQSANKRGSVEYQISKKTIDARKSNQRLFIRNVY